MGGKFYLGERRFETVCRLRRKMCWQWRDGRCKYSRPSVSTRFCICICICDSPIILKMIITKTYMVLTKCLAQL